MQAAKTDGNQNEIVQVFRGMNCTVALLHAVGKGIPDLLVGCRGVNLLVECKIKTGVLNLMQIEWHNHWSGQVTVCRSANEAADLVFKTWDKMGYLPLSPDLSKLNLTTKMIQALVTRRKGKNNNATK